MGTFLLTMLMLVGIFLMFIILLQRGRGGGLAGAFGGLGGQSAFGTKAGDVFTKITIVVVCLWVLLACLAGWRLRVEAAPGAFIQGAGVEEPAHEAGGGGGGGTSTPPGNNDQENLDLEDSGNAGKAPAKKSSSDGSKPTEGGKQSKKTGKTGNEAEKSEPNSEKPATGDSSKKESPDDK